MSAAVSVYRWAYQTLKNDATLAGIVSGVYTDVAPEDAALPFLVLQLQDAYDLRALGRTLADVVVLGVRVVGSEDIAPLEAAIERVDEVLPAATGTRDGVSIAACWREQQQYYVEVIEGTVYRHAVAQYRVIVA